MNRKSVVGTVACALLVASLPSPVRSLDAPLQTGQGGTAPAQANPAPQPSPAPPPPPGPVVDEEESLKQRRQQQRGITVDELKVYDDALLQAMLSAAQARLASLQVLDQAGIAAKIGAISGAELTSTSISLTAQTPSLPEVTTTDKGGTGSLKVTTKSDGTKVTNLDTETNTGLPTTDVTTKASAMPAPIPTASTGSTALPSGLSVSASDILSEQMQLTYEIANLRLLLDGAVSDRLFTEPAQLQSGATTGTPITRYKPRVTIGVPITVDPDKRYKDAVAVVELEIEGDEVITAEPLSITALLPREKTYNVASIRESNVQIGAGMVTQVVGFGASFGRARKTYYVVQDQDTVASTFEPLSTNAPATEPKPAKARSLGVAWQFRPVLGERFVRAGLKQTFVQVAFPSARSATKLGKVRIRTYWRKYDRGNGTAKDVVKESVVSRNDKWRIPAFPTLLPHPFIDGNNIEDLGNGTAMVDLEGPFLIGTAVRVGNTYLRDGSASTAFSARRVKFAASINDLVTRGAWLVARDGEERRLEIPRADDPKPAIASASATPLDEANSLLTVKLKDEPKVASPPLVLVVGGRVFGYADSPLVRNGPTLIATVPTALLVANPLVKATAMMAPTTFVTPASTRAVDGLDDRSRVERLTLVGETNDTATFLLYGYRLTGATVLLPPSATVSSVGGAADEQTLRLVSLKKADLKTHKWLVLNRKGERPVQIGIPATADAQPPKPEPKARDRALVNADVAVFDSIRLKELGKVWFKDRNLEFKVADDGKSVQISGLSAAGATAKAEIVTIQFLFGDTKVDGKLDVVNSRVETVAR